MRDSPVSYFMKNGVLMRKWRSPTVPASDEWETVYQIMVLQNCHAEVMKLAHSTPLAGHLGVSKTCSRILSHFYWPEIRNDARKFCRECQVCQMVGNPYLLLLLFNFNVQTQFEYNIHMILNYS